LKVRGDDMNVCPYCGHPLKDGSDRCSKCGAIIPRERESGAIFCPKCGGILSGTETQCPWCGFPCSLTRIREDTEAYQLLKTLENALRNFIQTKLTSIDHNWWEKRIPEEVQMKANRRKMIDERLYPWHVQKKKLHPIHYVDFSDYVKIITFDKNWRQVFQKFFKNKLFLVTKLKELEPIRRAIAHSKDISTKDLQKLKLYIEELLACIEGLSLPLERRNSKR